MLGQSSLSEMGRQARHTSRASVHLTVIKGEVRVFVFVSLELAEYLRVKYVLDYLQIAMCVCEFDIKYGCKPAQGYDMP